LRVHRSRNASESSSMPEDVMRYPFNWALLNHIPGGNHQAKMRSCGLTNESRCRYPCPSRIAAAPRDPSSVIRRRVTAQLVAEPSERWS
jgi:hypothetical protein